MDRLDLSTDPPKADRRMDAARRLRRIHALVAVILTTVSLLTLGQVVAAVLG